MLVATHSGAAEPAAKLAYQGRISESGRPATGTFEMRFRLFDTPEPDTGTPQGATVEAPGVVAQEGVFTAVLDFGTSVFDGSPRYLEIGVRKAGSTGPFSILAPRQAITPVPYAVQTLNAAPANGLFSDTGGNVSIGSRTQPEGVRLNVDGTTRFAPGGSGGFVQVGTPNGETGVSFTGTNRADLRFSRDTLTLAVGASSGPPAPWNGLTLNTNGNAGLGMTNLAPDSIWRLEVNGFTRITPNGAAGGAIQFSTPNAETGISILGVNRSDIRFDDSTLKLVAGPGSGPPGDASGLAVHTSGRVGIGTTTPAHMLHVESSQPNTRAIYARASGPDGIGVHAVSADGGRALHADGDATQAEDKAGFVKAMVEVGPNGVILKGYNPYGTTRVEHPRTGRYIVNFGFPLRGRFFALTCRDRFEGDPAGASYQDSGVGTNNLKVEVFDTKDGDPSDWFFTLLVF